MALCQFDITIFNFMAETSFEFFLKKLFVRYEVGKMRKEPPRLIFYSLFHSPNSYKQQGLGWTPKP